MLNLSVETLNDALIEVVKVLGGSKKVGLLMRPEKDAEEAGRWIRDCLNPGRREHLDHEQIMWLLREGRRHDCHVAMHYLASACGYAAPAPVAPTDEASELKRAFIESVRMQAQLVDRLAALEAGSAPSLRAVA